MLHFDVLKNIRYCTRVIFHKIDSKIHEINENSIKITKNQGVEFRAFGG